MKPFPTLSTTQLDLIEMSVSHVDAVFGYLSDPRVTKHEARDPLTDVAQAERYTEVRCFDGTTDQGIFWALVPKGATGMIGDIGYAVDHGLTAEVGFKLHPDHWNRGFMTEAVGAVVEYLLTAQPMVRVEAMARPENTGSIRVLEKCGFEKEGVMRLCEHHRGHSYDLAMYSRLRPTGS